MTDQTPRPPIADPTFEPVELAAANAADSQDPDATDTADVGEYVEPEYDEGELDPDDTETATDEADVDEEEP